MYAHCIAVINLILITVHSFTNADSSQSPLNKTAFQFRKITMCFRASCVCIVHFTYHYYVLLSFLVMVDLGRVSDLHLTS